MLLAATTVSPSRELLLLPGLGLAMILHRVPSQCSTRVMYPGVSPEPTAQMLFLETAVTAVRTLMLSPVLGLETSFHFEPFQCSTRVRLLFLEISKYVPTAQISFWESAQMPSSWLSEFPALGLGIMLHCVPSQCSMSVRRTPFL